MDVVQKFFASEERDFSTEWIDIKVSAAAYKNLGIDPNFEGGWRRES